MLLLEEELIGHLTIDRVLQILQCMHFILSYGRFTLHGNHFLCYVLVQTGICVGDAIC